VEAAEAGVVVVEEQSLHPRYLQLLVRIRAQVRVHALEEEGTVPSIRGNNQQSTRLIKKHTEHTGITGGDIGALVLVVDAILVAAVTGGPQPVDRADTEPEDGKLD
jgi:hypothetical protein